MDDDVLDIQRLYPQVYHACHVRHVGTRGNGEAISERDQSLLAHLSPREGRTASDLARHFGVGLPTLSEAVARLERLGLVERERSPADRRAFLLRLTGNGAAALRAGSVLDDARLRAALERLAPDERRAVVAGLALLARAAGELPRDPSRERPVSRGGPRGAGGGDEGAGGAA